MASVVLPWDPKEGTAQRLPEKGIESIYVCSGYVVGRVERVERLGSRLLLGRYYERLN